MSAHWRLAARLAAGVVAVVALVWIWGEYFGEPDRLSEADLAVEVKTSMQEKLGSDPVFEPYQLTVENVTLAKATDTTYNGVATVAAASGVRGDVPVGVTYDGGNVTWHSPPGAFLFLMEQP